MDNNKAWRILHVGMTFVLYALTLFQYAFKQEQPTNFRCLILIILTIQIYANRNNQV